MSRLFLALLAAAFLVSTAGTLQVQNSLATQPLRVARTTYAMGTTFSVVLYGSDPAAMSHAADAAFEEAHRLDALLSNYLPESEWSRVNREAAAHPVPVSPELFRLLSDCTDYSRATEGTFDLTVGPLMRAWGFFGGEHHVPSHEELAAARKLVGYEHVQLNAADRTVRFDHAGVEIDPGGVGKGYAVDRMVEILRARGIHNGLIAASGSTIFGLGNPPDEPRGWRISIADPWDHRNNAAQVFLNDQSLSTSGTYEKSFRVDGHRYSHIMDPRSGVPAEAAVQVTVIAPRAIDSEVWAKPFFIQGRSWTAAHKPKAWRVLYCDNTPAAPCSWVQ